MRHFCAFACFFLLYFTHFQHLVGERRRVFFCPDLGTLFSLIGISLFFSLSFASVPTTTPVRYNPVMNRIFRTLLLLFACGTSLLQSGVLAQNVTVVSTVETTTNATLTDITTLDVSQVNNANLSLSTLRSTTVNSEVLSSTLASDTVPIATLVSSTVPTATVGSTSVPVSTLASDTVPNATLVSSTVPTSTLESTSGPVSTLATRLTTNGVIVETGRINSTQNLNSTRTTGFQIIINEPKELNETAIKKNKSSLASSYPADFLPDDVLAI